MSLEWNNAYKIGNVEIDAQHQEIFRLANNFLNATNKGSLSVCAMGFFKHTREHFKHEEDLMKSLNYPGLKEHLVQHSELISLLNDVAKSIADDSLEMTDLEAFLSAWLLGHIGTFDKSLAAYAKLQT